jgi:chemotaxis protein methyltransferase CheR
MTHAIPDNLLAQGSEFITSRFGLHFPKKRWRDLERGIICAAHEFGFANPAACVRWLVTAELTQKQIDILAGCLTIGETYFFREQKSFEALENHILPELLGSRRGKDQRLRIWSAGCSTGEEAYSIGIMLQRLIADLPNWNVTILATDVNPESLRKGVQGEYSDWSFRGVPHGIKERYFTVDGTGNFTIAGAVRKMVAFAPLNLAEDTYPSLSNNTNAMDVIFCRNVLMYFAPEQAKRVVDKFRHSLVAGGWLIVSPTETSTTIFSGMETVHFHNAVFYRMAGRGKVAASPFPAATGAMAVPLLPLPAAEQFGAPGLPPPHPVKPLPAAVAQQSHDEQQVSINEEALALYRRGEYAAATAILTGFMANAPPASDSHRYGEAAALLARALANQGELAAALDWSEKAVAADRLNPQQYYLQATIFQEQGDDDAAVVALKRALYLDHGFVLAYLALANLTRRRGKTKEAAKHLENAASLLKAYGDDEILPGSEGMSARRLGEIVAATRVSVTK